MSDSVEQADTKAHITTHQTQWSTASEDGQHRIVYVSNTPLDSLHLIKLNLYRFVRLYSDWLTYLLVSKMTIDRSFPWTAEFWAEPRNLLFCHGNEPSRRIVKFLEVHSKTYAFFSSLEPGTRQKNNQYFVRQVFVHTSWPLSMSSLVMCNIFSLSNIYISINVNTI